MGATLSNKISKQSYLLFSYVKKIYDSPHLLPFDY
jgi:hypothetical protein